MNSRLAPLYFAVAALSVAGCTQKLETEYGSRTGRGATSVNGTSVLADMFETAGHRISGTHWAGPKLARSDVIVWFPDSMRIPDSRERRWFEDWLCQSPGRTLVYVGRDYDAAIRYWEIASKASTGEQQAAAQRELELAQMRFVAERMAMPPRTSCNWFTSLRQRDERQVHELSGDEQWRSGIDAKRVDIQLNGRLVPRRGATRLLSSGQDALVFERTFCSSRLLVVANGSFLLNLPLVNHEHRKLAGKLIESVGSTKRVAFLESGPSGLKIYDKEPEAAGRSGLAVLVTEPFATPMLHLAVVGIVFCLSRLPIFGRPRAWQPEGLADFGAHVTALGKLLAATKDRAFALAALASYNRGSQAGMSRQRPATTSAPLPSTAAANVQTPAEETA